MEVSQREEASLRAKAREQMDAQHVELERLRARVEELQSALDSRPSVPAEWKCVFGSDIAQSHELPSGMMDDAEDQHTQPQGPPVHQLARPSPETQHVDPQPLGTGDGSVAPRPTLDGWKNEYVPPRLRARQQAWSVGPLDESEDRAQLEGEGEEEEEEEDEVAPRTAMPQPVPAASGRMLRTVMPVGTVIRGPGSAPVSSLFALLERSSSS